MAGIFTFHLKISILEIDNAISKLFHFYNTPQYSQWLNHSLNFEHLPRGIYLLSLKDKKGLWYQERLMKLQE